MASVPPIVATCRCRGGLMPAIAGATRPHRPPNRACARSGGRPPAPTAAVKARCVLARDPPAANPYYDGDFTTSRQIGGLGDERIFRSLIAPRVSGRSPVRLAPPPAAEGDPSR